VNRTGTHGFPFTYFHRQDRRCTPGSSLKGKMGLRTAWLSSGEDDQAIRLFEGIYNQIVGGGLPLELCCAFCNHDPGQTQESGRFHAAVRKTEVPLLTISSASYRAQFSGAGEWRVAFDRAVVSELTPFHPELVVFAGYMLIASEVLYEAFPVINLHPALPGGPIGKYAIVLKKLVEQRSAEAGVMMHRVTKHIDRGPALTYCSFSLEGVWSDSIVDPTVASSRIRTYQLQRELPLLAETLRLIGTGVISPTSAEQTCAPLCLNHQILKYQDETAPPSRSTSTA
jgi:folate-dependent phosphoribosylglycinamide formyltransferase PurN